MKLSRHFTLAEFTRSAAATRLGLENTPNDAELANLYLLALTLEGVRKVMGHQPIIITSGFRSRRVNAAVGGSPHSAHCQGLAADFVCPAFGTPLQVCQAIAESFVSFDQLIHEKGRWVHLGLSASTPRLQRLTFDGRTYQPGLHRVDGSAS
jgi:zinc D-Ala-D-Ala carboxypeptidase